MSLVLQDDVREYMWDWLRQYINDYCIERVPLGQPKLPSRNNDVLFQYMFYLRRGLFDSTFLNYVGMLFWDKFALEYRKKPFQIAGLETASTPLIVGLTMTAPAFEIHVNSFSIRKEKKKYGLFNRFEGVANNDVPVMIVDDLINSSASIQEARHACLMEGLTVKDTVFALVDKEFTVTKDFEEYTMFENTRNNIDYVSLFSYNHFDLSYEVYQSKKQLTEAAE